MPVEQVFDAYVYADETGHEDDPKRHVFGIAGFVGRREAWDKFVERWAAVPLPLEDRPFHMKSFVNKYKTDAEQRLLIGPLVDAITQSQIVPICAVVLYKNRQQVKRPYDQILSQFFGQLTLSALEASDPRDDSCAPFPAPPPRLSVVFAHRRYASRACDAWWKAKKIGRGPMSSLLSCLAVQSVSIAEPSTVIPLQVADLLAYEIGHHYQIIKPTQRKMRFPLRRIKEMPTIMGLAAPLFNVLAPNILNPKIMQSKNLLVVQDHNDMPQNGS